MHRHVHLKTPKVKQSGKIDRKSIGEKKPIWRGACKEGISLIFTRNGLSFTQSAL